MTWKKSHSSQLDEELLNDSWTAISILQHAQQHGDKGNIQDYEYYKGLLRQCGDYGYERQLANILEV